MVRVEWLYGGFDIVNKKVSIYIDETKRKYDSFLIKSITLYIPTADPYLDRSFILEQLGISKEQDELIQKEYGNL